MDRDTGLFKLLTICQSFGESNDIVFNQKKSASLYFISKMLKGAHLPNVYLNGVLVEKVDSVKYLGHFLTNELSDDIDIRRQCWWNYKKMSVTKRHITFHNILKRNIGLSKFDSTSATCAFTNTQCCQSTIRNLIFKFMCRLNTSDNALIKA